MEMATTTPSTNTDGQPSVIKSFVHRRQPSKGEALVPAPQSAEIQHVDNTRGPPAMDRQPRSATAQAGHGLALGEIQLNQQERGSSPLRREYQLQHQQQQQFDQQQHQQQTRGRSTSPTKSRSANPFRSRNQSRDPSPTKSTGRARGIAGFLSRPKSMVLGGSNSNNNGSSSNEGDKENVSPVEVHPPPIYAQFTSDASVRQANRSSVQIGAFGSASSYASDVRPTARERPKSYHASVAASQQQQPPSPTRPQYQQYQQQQQQQQDTPRRAAHHQRTRSAVPSSSNTAGPSLAPEDIDRHLEAMLDRRNIPENQRYKMRNLSDTIKMEFIRQDFAEMQAARAQAGTGTAAGSTGSANSANSAKGSSSGSNRNSRDEAVASSGPDAEPEKPRHTRGRSFTWGRSKKSSSSRSPSKKTSSRSRFMGEGTSLGRHFRTKSSESLVGGDRPTSSGSAVSGGDGGSAGGSGGSGHGGGFLSKLKMQQGPGDYVAYLARVRQPEQVEVGKLHKLRLLLRNETVAWIEEFMDRGGMTEIVGLLHRIMDVEWREEHEDALLHENLLCLKALSTTARGMQHLHDIEGDLFPKLLHLLFDPEKKGPSEFTTRGIVPSVLFAYIRSASPTERVSRAACVARHLRDPEPDEGRRPLPFVSDMHQERPYRVWNKEVVSVTKEVFWIFLHNLNVVSLPPQPTDSSFLGQNSSGSDYMERHFPHERPPVPAAPYVGGVEWDATNYLASHLDLMNAVLACTPSAQARNALRAQLRVSGFERCMGASLRLCKEKFYGAVHDGLRTWVAAAAEDCWPVKDVRFGPPPADTPQPPRGARSASPVKRSALDEPPKLEVPRLDFS